MVGKFENVKVITKEQRQSNKGGIYYIYNLLSNGKIMNIYSTENFPVDEKEHTAIIDISSYNNNLNAKLVEVK